MLLSPPGEETDTHVLCVQIAGSLEASEALTLSDDKARVRRTKPLTSAEHAMAQIDQRSLYASPFPHDTSLDGIAGFFQQRAPVNCVRMRRHAESKDFRGSVFVEFADEEAAQKVRSCVRVAPLMSPCTLTACNMHPSHCPLPKSEES